MSALKIASKEVSNVAAPTSAIAARFRCVEGRTILSQSYCRAPLKIAKSFAQPDGSLALCIMDCSPGLLDGDYYDFDWHLETTAHVALTNQSFTRVHPARSVGARQTQSIRLERGAKLEYLPEPVLLFRAAILRAECFVDLAPQSTLFLSDILCAGRIGRGERFQFVSWRNHLEVRLNGDLIFCSRQKWPLSSSKVLCAAAPAAWDNRTHWGNFYGFGDWIEATRGGALVTLWRDELEKHPRVWGGAGLLHRCGIIASILGDSAWDVQQAIGALHRIGRDWTKE